MLNETFSVIFKHCVESFFPFFLIGKRRDYGRRPNSASVLEARAPRRWRIFINNSTLMTCHTTNSYIEQCMVMVWRRKCKLHFGYGQWRSVCLSGCLWYYFSIWKWRWRHTFTHICTSRIISSKESRPVLKRNNFAASHETFVISQTYLKPGPFLRQGCTTSAEKPS